MQLSNAKNLQRHNCANCKKMSHNKAQSCMNNWHKQATLHCANNCSIAFLAKQAMPKFKCLAMQILALANNTKKKAICNTHWQHCKSAGNHLQKSSCTNSSTQKKNADQAHKHTKATQCNTHKTKQKKQNAHRSSQSISKSQKSKHSSS